MFLCDIHETHLHKIFCHISFQIFLPKIVRCGSSCVTSCITRRIGCNMRQHANYSRNQSAQCWLLLLLWLCRRSGCVIVLSWFRFRWFGWSLFGILVHRGNSFMVSGFLEHSNIKVFLIGLIKYSSIVSNISSTSTPTPNLQSSKA